MTRPITFQEAQQAVAEKYGRIDWSTVIYEDSLHTPDLEQMYIEAAELMAKSWANYYVEVKIQEIKNVAEQTAPGGPLEIVWLDDIVELITVPFPEER